MVHLHASYSGRQYKMEYRGDLATLVVLAQKVGNHGCMAPLLATTWRLQYGSYYTAQRFSVPSRICDHCTHASICSFYTGSFYFLPIIRGTRVLWLKMATRAIFRKPRFQHACSIMWLQNFAFKFDRQLYYKPYHYPEYRGKLPSFSQFDVLQHNPEPYDSSCDVFWCDSCNLTIILFRREGSNYAIYTVALIA